MTTIVYCKKTNQIAIDSRVTQGDHILSDKAVKFITNEVGTWFYSGNMSQHQRVVSAIGGELVKRVELDSDIDGYSGFVVSDGKVYLYHSLDGFNNTYEIEYSDSCGSGADHAITALDMGASAKKAVKMAIKRDSKSGGKVHVFDCEKMEFIDE